MFVARGQGVKLEVAGSKTICSKVLLIRGLFLSFRIPLNKAAFCRVLASICEAQLFFCVTYAMIRLTQL